jgi:hypothetical protein
MEETGRSNPRIVQIPFPSNDLKTSLDVHPINLKHRLNAAERLVSIRHCSSPSQAEIECSNGVAPAGSQNGSRLLLNQPAATSSLGETNPVASSPPSLIPEGQRSRYHWWNAGFGMDNLE